VKVLLEKDAQTISASGDLLITTHYTDISGIGSASVTRQEDGATLEGTITFPEDAVVTVDQAIAIRVKTKAFRCTVDRHIKDSTYAVSGTS